MRIFDPGGTYHIVGQSTKASPEDKQSCYSSKESDQSK
jgi:hypothetical protein